MKVLIQGIHTTNLSILFNEQSENHSKSINIIENIKETDNQIIDKQVNDNYLTEIN